MTITNTTRAQLEQLAHQLKNLKVEEREALDQMLPERKVFRASEEERAHQDLVYANARGSLKEQAQRVESEPQASGLSQERCNAEHESAEAVPIDQELLRCAWPGP